MTQPVDFIALEPAIVAACDAHEATNGRLRHYSCSFPYQDVFVKFGAASSFVSEMETQNYLARLAAVDPRAPRIAKVFHVFVRDRRMAYAIMERITMAPTQLDELAIIKVAEAISWMQQVQPPEGLVFGPLGSAPARHILFPDGVAPSNIKSRGALERYFNAAIERYLVNFPGSVANVSLADEALVFTQSDMHPSNFGIDADGRPVLFDFGDVGWLPASFGLYTLFWTTAFARQVVAHMHTPEVCRALAASPNLASMSKVAHITRRTSPRGLGLDDDCYRKAKVSSISSG